MTPFLLFSAEISLDIINENENPKIIFTISEIPLQPFLDSMDEGYTTEIIYMFRLRKKSALGILLPLSGENQAERIVYTGKKDFLTGGYFIESDGNRVYYSSEASFAMEFFSCRTALPDRYRENTDLIIEAKAVADLIRRPPPMTMLDPFYKAEKTETAWTRLGR